MLVLQQILYDKSRAPPTDMWWIWGDLSIDIDVFLEVHHRNQVIYCIYSTIFLMGFIYVTKSE